MTKKDIKWYSLESLFRFGVLALGAVLIFAGVMSLVPEQTDVVVRYALASVVVVFVVKEVW